MPSADAKAPRIRRMFNRLASRYDALNRLMTLGRDRAWCRAVARAAAPPAGGRWLDVGAGTGAILRAGTPEGRDLRCVAADFSLGMITVGRRRLPSASVDWCAADALDLPFPDDTFDAVTSGYLVRNVSDVARAFAEQYRVARPGGRVVCLETSPPPPGPWQSWIRWYLNVAIPALGRWFSGHPSAYRYLPDSTQAFMTPEALAAVMRAAGLQGVAYKRFMFGTIVIASGRKPLRGRSPEALPGNGRASPANGMPPGARAL